MPTKKKFHLKDVQELVNRSIASVGVLYPASWLFNVKEIMQSQIEYMWNLCPHCSRISAESLITLALVIGWQAGRDKWKLSAKGDSVEVLSEEELIQLSATIGQMAAYMELPLECSDMQKFMQQDEEDN